VTKTDAEQSKCAVGGVVCTQRGQATTVKHVSFVDAGDITFSVLIGNDMVSI